MDMTDQYMIQSNRESGFGRYDVILEPKQEGLDAVILEFKVFNPRRETTLEDTVQEALSQIEQKRYDRVLRERGIPGTRIRKYGFAFRGKEVLIGDGVIPVICESILHWEIFSVFLIRRSANVRFLKRNQKRLSCNLVKLVVK